MPFSERGKLGADDSPPYLAARWLAVWPLRRDTLYLEQFGNES
jgi:hypothetical protein